MDTKLTRTLSVLVLVGAGWLPRGLPRLPYIPYGLPSLPAPAAPNNMIAPLWTDLDLASKDGYDGGAWYAAVVNDGESDDDFGHGSDRVGEFVGRG